MAPPPSSAVPVADVATVDVGDLAATGSSARAAAVAALGESLVRTGFVKVGGSPISAERLRAAYRAAEEVFALPDEAKAAYVVPELHGARGLVAFGGEKAKDASVADLKEFWHVGPPDGEPANVWPVEVPAFAVELTALRTAMAATAEVLLCALGDHLGLAPRRLADLVTGSDSILRVLHYPPVPAGADPAAVRAAAHEDINFLTLLPAASDAGLQLRDRSGRWCRVDGDEGELVVDSGDQLSRYLNGRVPATTHRVVNPDDPGRHRYSLPFFCQPRPEVVLAPPPELRGPGEVVEAPLTAGEYHAERMAAIRAR